MWSNEVSARLAGFAGRGEHSHAGLWARDEKVGVHCFPSYSTRGKLMGECWAPRDLAPGDSVWQGALSADDEIARLRSTVRMPVTAHL